MAPSVFCPTHLSLHSVIQHLPVVLVITSESPLDIYSCAIQSTKQSQQCEESSKDHKDQMNVDGYRRRLITYDTSAAANQHPSGLPHHTEQRPTTSHRAAAYHITPSSGLPHHTEQRPTTSHRAAAYHITPSSGLPHHTEQRPTTSHRAAAYHITPSSGLPHHTEQRPTTSHRAAANKLH